MCLTRVRTTIAALLAVFALSWVLAGCGSDSDEPSADASSTPASSTSSQPTTSDGCAEVEALQDSLDALVAVEVRNDGVEALTSALADVATALDTAVQSASAELQPSVDAVRTAVDSLQAAASGLTTDNLGEKAPDITEALREVGTSTKALTSAISETCVS